MQGRSHRGIENTVRRICGALRVSEYDVSLDTLVTELAEREA
jgi:hypothetical protein